MTGKEARLLLAVLLWAALLHGVGRGVLRLLPLSREVPAWWPTDPRSDFDRHPLVRWDSLWYVDLATHGYEWKPDARAHTTAYLPLYPAAVAALSAASGLGTFAAGEILSLAFLLGAVLLISRYSRDEGFSPGFTVGALLLFPTAFFFLAVYSESLFLLASAGCLRALQRRRPLACALWGAAAGFARPNGFVLSIPVAMEARALRSPRLAFAAAAPLAGHALLALYFWRRFGRAILFAQTQVAGWHHRLKWPWRPFIEGWRWAPLRRHDVLATLLFLLLAALLARSGRAALGSYVAASLLLVLSTGSLGSAIRYVAVLFPAFLPLGEMARRSQAFRLIAGTAGAAGLILLTAEFALGLWVG